MSWARHKLKVPDLKVLNRPTCSHFIFQCTLLVIVIHSWRKTIPLDPFHRTSLTHEVLRTIEIAWDVYSSSSAHTKFPVLVPGGNHPNHLSLTSRKRFRTLWTNIAYNSLSISQTLPRNATTDYPTNCISLNKPGLSNFLSQGKSNMHRPLLSQSTSVQKIHW